MDEVVSGSECVVDEVWFTSGCVVNEVRLMSRSVVDEVRLTSGCVADGFISGYVVDEKCLRKGGCVCCGFQWVGAVLM